MAEINQATFYDRLARIQTELEAPKGQVNTFGGYKYRSCEDILSAVKPLLKGLVLTINDETWMVGNRYYIKATVTLTDGKNSITNSAFAREPELKKGMDESQITGATSSYARKYALNGLLAIDDTKDADSMDNTKEGPVKKVVSPTTASPAPTHTTTKIAEDQTCEIHKCVVHARMGKNGKPYWGCTAEPKMHFLDDPNKQYNDEDMPSF